MPFSDPRVVLVKARQTPMRQDHLLRKIGAGLTALLLLVCGFGPRGWALQATQQSKKQTVKQGKSQPAVETPEETAALARRFQADVWPLLARNCTGCHGAANPSQLHIPGDADAAFKQMMTDGHLDPTSPTSLLARVTTPDAATHMPPKPMPAWTEDEIARLRKFCIDAYAHRLDSRQALDEQFPQALLAPYRGKVPGGGDNTFLTYYQLKGKIKTLFNDSWERDGKDLFTENLAHFGGADFVHSYNESARPTAEFLSGVDALAADVTSRAFLTLTGPFAGMAASLPAPTPAAPSPAYRHEIDQLFQRMLFRPATPQEMQQSYRFLQAIDHSRGQIAAQPVDLRFELIAKDERGLTSHREISVHALNDGYGLGQTLVNENDHSSLDPKGKIARFKLDGPFTLKANDAGQRVTISNANTHGSVVVSGVEIRGPLPANTIKSVSINDPGVQAQGAWNLSHDNGVDCYDDGDQNKGASSLTLPIHVEKAGTYELTLLARAGGPHQVKRHHRMVWVGDRAENVLVEVQSCDKYRLAIPEANPVPPKYQADFTIDESDDTVSFHELETIFQFEPGDNVELVNEGTHQKVVADALRFTPVSMPGAGLAGSALKPFMVKTQEAEGQDQWKEYKTGEYTFYKPVGPRVVTDEGDDKLKGKLHLTYRPMVNKEWRTARYYKLALGCPASVENDGYVPIRVHAHASSPILRINYPVRAHVGAKVTLDAGSSYNLQGTPLQFTWRQIGGARVALSDPHSSHPSFVVVAESSRQAGWEGLCRAMMKHPDFLFTRPLSLATTKDAKARRRLQLVKVAQDLVGRPPNASELMRLDHGAPFADLVNGYLGSNEFADFYYRRIRLYLESHGTTEDDEPARLWSYIAFNDRPFKEILTADYTVDSDWNRQPRPAYTGHSGVLTMPGFIKGKPGLPHYNYAAQVCEKFLGYVFVVPLEIVKIRNGLTAASTTSPGSVCYSCHQVLTPLAWQRSRFTDEGVFKEKDSSGQPIDDTDHQLVATYPFKGAGLAAFAQQAVNKERFLRTILQTHYIFYFGREMRFDRDERALYKRLWATEKKNNYNIKGLIRSLVLSPEYLNGSTRPAALPPVHVPAHRRRADVALR